MESSARNNYRDYRFVSLQSNTASFMMNNLTTTDGENFAYVNSYDGQPRVVIYGKDLVEKGEVAPP